MLLFDAVVACILIKWFGTDCIYALGLTVIITILRTSLNVNRGFEIFEAYIAYLMADEDNINKEEEI